MKKVIIITGASRGIGAATALLAAKHGYAVCINYNKNKTAADAVLAEIIKHGGEAITVAADVSLEQDVIRLFETVDAQLGTLTALVNNAGIVETQMRLESMTAERLDRVFRTNITSSFLCCREAVKRMTTRDGGEGGAIVNVSSIASRAGSANAYIDYAASKGAIDTLTRGLAKEVAAEGIRVNAVCPGVIYTDIHADGGEPDRVERLKSSIPMQRGGDATEVADAILWLLDNASFSTGSFIDVSGGSNGF